VQDHAVITESDSDDESEKGSKRSKKKLGLESGVSANRPVETTASGQGETVYQKERSSRPRARKDKPGM